MNFIKGKPSLLTLFILFVFNNSSTGSENKVKDLPTANTILTPDQKKSSQQIENDLFEKGKTLFVKKACNNCHSINSDKVKMGPSLFQIYKREVALENDSKIKADEDYLRESILEPNLKISKGFHKGVMPNNFKDKLDKDDVQALIEYIKKLN